MRWAALLLACAACRPSPPALPAGLTWVQTPADALQWAGPEFLQLVTPVRPPTTADRATHIVAVVRLPPGRSVATRPTVSGERETVMPNGARAARIEFAGAAGSDLPIDESWRVLDVRQFDWDAGGLRCTVLRPTPSGGLAGVSWRCGITDDARAGEALVQLAHDGRLGGGPKLAAINACVTCHAPRRLEDRSPGALVQRATDGDGLFSLRSLLRNEDPVERYRPIDSNEGDPFLSPVCPTGLVDAGHCFDGTRARVRLDVRAAVSHGDSHALQVCVARARLSEQLDPEGSLWLRALLDDCVTGQ